MFKPTTPQVYLLLASFFISLPAFGENTNVSYPADGLIGAFNQKIPEHYFYSKGNYVIYLSKKNELAAGPCRVQNARNGFFVGLYQKEGTMTTQIGVNRPDFELPENLTKRGQIGQIKGNGQQYKAVYYQNEDLYAELPARHFGNLLVAEEVTFQLGEWHQTVQTRIPDLSGVWGDQPDNPKRVWANKVEENLKDCFTYANQDFQDSINIAPR